MDLAEDSATSQTTPKRENFYVRYIVQGFKYAKPCTFVADLDQKLKTKKNRKTEKVGRERKFSRVR